MTKAIALAIQKTLIELIDHIEVSEKKKTNGR